MTALKKPREFPGEKRQSTKRAISGKKQKPNGRTSRTAVKPKKTAAKAISQQMLKNPAESNHTRTRI
jgi:hypothetical protein